jgi:hypothetical protein
MIEIKINTRRTAVSVNQFKTALAAQLTAQFNVTTIDNNSAPAIQSFSASDEEVRIIMMVWNHFSSSSDVDMI